MSDIFIDVRNTRAYVSRRRGTETSWSPEPCTNWEALEELAGEAVESVGGHSTMSGIYPCPERIAALAIWPENVFDLVMPVTQVTKLYGISKATVTRALTEGRVRGKQYAKNWIVYAPDAEREWKTR